MEGFQAAAMAVLDEIETCHTQSAPLCSVPSDGADEQSCRADHVLSLFANQEVCDRCTPQEANCHLDTSESPY